MTYVSWAAMYEGTSDAAYFGVLFPRLMDELLLVHGIRASTIPVSPALLLKRADVMSVAQEACESADAFHLLFIHADTGGRGLQENVAQRSIAYCEAMHALCGVDPRRCITVAPKHETEAWLLCDPSAVMGALGFRGAPGDIGLPGSAREAEGLLDPKAALRNAITSARGRRRDEPVGTLYPAIAQRQNFVMLRKSMSFKAFEDRVIEGLKSLGCL